MKSGELTMENGGETRGLGGLGRCDYILSFGNNKKSYSSLSLHNNLYLCGVKVEAQSRNSEIGRQVPDKDASLIISF